MAGRPGSALRDHPAVLPQVVATIEFGATAEAGPLLEAFRALPVLLGDRLLLARDVAEAGFLLVRAANTVA